MINVYTDSIMCNHVNRHMDFVSKALTLFTSPAVASRTTVSSTLASCAGTLEVQALGGCRGPGCPSWVFYFGRLRCRHFPACLMYNWAGQFLPWKKSTSLGGWSHLARGSTSINTTAKPLIHQTSFPSPSLIYIYIHALKCAPYQRKFSWETSELRTFKNAKSPGQ